MVQLARLSLLLPSLLFLGCSIPVAAGLDETDANRIVVVLDRSEIDGNKEVDPTAEGKFRVLVARDDVARALTAMRDEELPRPKPPGVLDAMDKGALVPSAQAEHAQMVAGLGGDLERTLESVDGVLSARVHLNLPAPDPLRDKAPDKATASVLVEHRGSTPPITTEAVQKLVAGGVNGLQPSDVAVVTVSRAAPAEMHESQLAHVGPFAVARSSSRTLQIVMGGLLALVVALMTASLFLYTRLVRARAELEKKP
jgi:type III secretion protein J